MASAGLQLQMNSLAVEGKVKTLINNDLKLICKAYNQPVSGTKTVLQARCLAILRNIVQSGDTVGFGQFSSRVHNHGGPPTQPIQQQPLSMPAVMQRPVMSVQQSRLEFRNSPFIERLEMVIRPSDMPEMPQNRHMIKTNLTLSESQASRLFSDPEQYRLMVYCANPSVGLYTTVDVAFPPQIEIKVNDDEVKANFRGLKNKPGSTKPADITKFVRLKAGYSNKLSICYALTNKRFTYVVWLVRYISADTLVQKIRSNRVFPKEKVLEEYARQNADPDIAATLSKMSLKDPVSTTRISVPIRSTICSHNQCFDASCFLQLQEQAPTWQCPICSRTVSFESLSIDKYFEEILQNTPQVVDQVTVEPDGQWRAVIEDDTAPSRNEKKPRAAYDNDSDDDDLIVVDDPPVIKKEEPTTSFAAIANINTPPLSSREPSIALPQSAAKRTSTVIDLTLSDDEDEPPRPAKRTRVVEPVARTAPLLPTPLPLYSGRPQAHQPLGMPQPSTRTDFSANTNNIPISPVSVSPFTTNVAPAAAFGRTNELSSRPNTHLGTSATNLLHQWSTFRPPPSAMPGAPDLQRRLSASRMGERDSMGLLSWQQNPVGLSSSEPPLQAQAADHSTYTGFNDSRFVTGPPARDAFPGHRLSNGFSGNPPSA